jgi:hypothetical protein
MIGILNHPNFGLAVRAEDFAAVEEVRLFEVFNGHPSVGNYGDAVYPSTERLWDIVLALRLGKLGMPPVLGVGTDDAHRYFEYNSKQANPGRGWIMVRARHLTPESLVRAIETGDFYASSGVALRDVSFENQELRVKIEPQPNVEYKTQFIATRRGTSLEGTPQLDKDGKPRHVTGTYSADIGKVVHEMTGLDAAYRMTPEDLYVRARVISSKLHPNPYKTGDREMAWTQPIVGAKGS